MGIEPRMPRIDRTLVLRLAELASAAGAAVMAARARGPEVRLKADASPVTEADERAEAVLLRGLAALAPGVPALSEERCGREGFTPVGRRFFLVDPLDGTREFVADRCEFTINIALVEDERPVLGCVYAPMLSSLYLGVVGEGAWKAEVAPGGAVEAAALAAIHTRIPPAEGLTALVSRSHADAQTPRFLARLPVRETQPLGSSLKFCLVAEGAADVYARFTPTMEWDTAAGHAVLLAAGGVVTIPGGAALTYAKRAAGWVNGPYAAWGGRPLADLV